MTGSNSIWVWTTVRRLAVGAVLGEDDRVGHLVDELEPLARELDDRLIGDAGDGRELKADRLDQGRIARAAGGHDGVIEEALIVAGPAAVIRTFVGVVRGRL